VGREAVPLRDVRYRSSLDADADELQLSREAEVAVGGMLLHYGEDLPLDLPRRLVRRPGPAADLGVEAVAPEGLVGLLIS